jgi:hypothetical protein
MVSPSIPVGAPARRTAGHVVFASLALALAFTAVTWWAKETPALDLTQPWQDDPYDVMVSLDFVVLPVLAAMIAWRALLCRRYSTLSARRVADLLRACTAVVGTCLVTEAGEWTALALGLNRRLWTPLTGWQVAVLAAFTACTLWIGVVSVAVAGRLRAIAAPAPHPDWLADFIALGMIASRRLRSGGEAAATAVRRLDREVGARVRRHPVAASALVAGALAAPFTAAKIVLEGYPPLLVLVSFALPAAILFAFVVLVGGYLRIVTPTWARAPRGLAVAVVACCTGPAAFAFHDSFPAFQTQLGLNVLLFGGALAGALATLIVQRVRGRSRGRTV